MKAKVLKGYPDRITHKFYEKGTIVDFEKERIEELINKGLVEKEKNIKKTEETEGE